jgi:hypothetical protein
VERGSGAPRVREPISQILGERPRFVLLERSQDSPRAVVA